MNKITDISQVYRFLDTLPSFQTQGAVAVKPGLDRIKTFCSEIGNPQDKVPCIHVAGTNGKGSVCAVLNLAYQNAGYRCGMYSSPHLNHISERIRINGASVPEDELLLFFSRHGELLQKIELSYFEITTAAAFWWFEKEKVDLAILETGLGGRLDATNIVTPEVSVITSIGFDHCEFLGNSLTGIAREKAGIIKKGRPVVIGYMPETAGKTIRRIAKERGSELLNAKDLKPGFRKGSTGQKNFIQFLENGKYVTLPTDLMAPVHRWNIATARLALQMAAARFPVSLSEFGKAIGMVQESGLLPARFEKLVPSMSWYFDGAHNAEAVRSLMETIERQEWRDQPVMVMSFMRDKAQKKILEPFSVFKKNYYYTMKTERAAEFAQIAPYISNIKSLPPCEEEIVDFFKGFTKKVVIFTGSFYFYGVVKRWVSRIIKAD